MNSETLTRRLIALCLAVAVMGTPALYAAGRIRLTGELTASGSTKVDGQPAISGQTLFSGSTVDTAANSAAAVSLGARGRVWLMTNSSARLMFDESNLSCLLGVGRVRLSVPGGSSVQVTAQDATVVADPSEPAAFSVEFANGRLTVAVLTGHVELRTAGRTQQVRAGEVAGSEDGAGSQSVGRNNFSGRKVAGLLLAIGGALTIAAFIFANGNEESMEPLDFGGCVQILSPTSDGGGCS